jgi:hypothetical protein
MQRRERPTMPEIAAAQSDDENLRNLIAAGYFYTRAKWLHFGGASVGLLLALAAPFVLIYRPEWGPKIGAIGGLWIFVTRVGLERFTREFKLKGATAQERFDCDVFGLEWNDSLTRGLSDEEIHRASREMKNREKVEEWYPAKGDDVWPKSVLICQRANAVWARRQHKAYSGIVVSLAVGWGIAGVIIAGLHSASLTDYLVTILLPSLPAFLDATDLARTHAAASAARQLLEDQADALLAAGPARVDELREIQDQLFNLRREAPLVPGWFYKMIRSGYEADMHYAARQASKSGSDRQAPSL